MIDQPGSCLFGQQASLRVHQAAMAKHSSSSTTRQETTCLASFRTPKIGPDSSGYDEGDDHSSGSSGSRTYLMRSTASTTPLRARDGHPGPPGDEKLMEHRASIQMTAPKWQGIKE